MRCGLEYAPGVSESIGLARIAELARGAVSGSAATIAAVAELAQRLSGVDITIVSEITQDGRYVFRGLESRVPIPVSRDDAIPYPMSLCSRIHAGESPATVPDAEAVPGLWSQWLRLKDGLGVDWDVRAFCTRDVLLADGTRFGTVCFHHRTPRLFSRDEEALLEVLARLLAQEVGRERAAAALHEATEALAAAERLRVELAEELRHELRAPLQVIDGYGEAMLDGVLEASDEHLVLLRGEAARAMGLLDDIIDLTRIEAEPAPTSGSVDLGDVVREMCGRLAPLAEAEGVRLVARGEGAAVRGDARRIEQLVVNLVRNAIGATARGEGTRIEVTAAREARAVVLTVADDGPGIAPDALPRVFDRFYRGRSERDARMGSGLGLTIARRIAEGMSGTIEAAAADGGGAVLTVRLPLAEEVVDQSQPGVQP